MSKKIVIPLLLLLVVAVGAFAYSRRPSTDAPQAPVNQTTNQAMDEAVEFANAVQSGQPTLCTVAKGEEKMEYKIKGQKLRADITASNGVSHMIHDTTNYYIWADGQKQGTKMTIAATQEVANNAQQTAPSLATEADYRSLKDLGYSLSCVAGNVSDSEFTPPSDVTFQDLSAMMQAIPSPVNGQIDYNKFQP